MRPYQFLLSLLIALQPLLMMAQEEEATIPTEYSANERNSRPDYINSGFYLKMGPVIPVGPFTEGQTLFFPPFEFTNYPPAKIGGEMEMGFLIYLGPSVANNFLRFGIDACFLNPWFNSSNPVDLPEDKDEIEMWYYALGQKFGPLITVNPVDRLMIDLSYKLNANLGWHNSVLGYGLTNQEVMMNVRYRVILFSFQYNFGRMNFNGLDNTQPDHYIDNSTIRVLFGFKF
jgi:hypothetical protein